MQENTLARLRVSRSCQGNEITQPSPCIFLHIYTAWSMNHGVSPKFPHSTFAQSMTCIALTAHEPQDGTSLFSGPERVAWIGWPFGRNTPCYISGHLIVERTLNWDKNVPDIEIYLLEATLVMEMMF